MSSTSTPVLIGGIVGKKQNLLKVMVFEAAESQR
jgi:hypothetical protein